MKKKLTKEMIEAFAELAQVAAKEAGYPAAYKVEGEYVSFHVLQPMICDNCQDDKKEAFPYGIYDGNGKYWEHLCNQCFDDLGCRYDWSDDWSADEDAGGS